MKSQTLLPILALLITGTLSAQDQPDIRKLMNNPDFLSTKQVLDSVVLYTIGKMGDSSFLRKWEFIHSKEEGMHESVYYFWNATLKAWSPPRSKYVYGIDPQGKLIHQAHYTYMYYNGLWKGCDSDGCGKKEWAYDAMGNQILRTQAYWNVNARHWNTLEIHENLYDLSGKMVLEANRYQDPYYGWSGSKDEYSFDNRGNQIGHVSYGWDEYNRNDWVFNNKEERTYDSNGNITTDTFYTWQGGWSGISGSWGYVYLSRVEWRYDADGRKESVIFYSWDSDSKSWLVVFDEKNVYNTAGQLVSETEVAGTGLGFSPVRKEYAYDPAGNRISVITTSWGSSWWSQGWTNPEKNEYTYDADKRITSKVLSYWNGETNSWTKSSKTGYSFDQAGHLTEEITYIWNSESHNWQQSIRREWSYDSLGRQVLYAYYTWSWELQKWYGSEKEEKTFDVAGRLIMEAYFQWDWELDGWIGNAYRWNSAGNKYLPGKIEYGYNESGNLILYSSYKWDKDINDWTGFGEEGGKKEWGYDTNGRLFQEILYNWDPAVNNWTKASKYEFMFHENGDPALQNQYTWNQGILDWELLFRSYYFYRSTITGAKEVLANSILVWPNPTSGIISISGLPQPADVQVYSVQGQLMKTVQQAESTVDVSDLPAGVYLLNIPVGKNLLVRKMVVRK